jgi:hypothetical protein
LISGRHGLKSIGVKMNTKNSFNLLDKNSHIVLVDRTTDIKYLVYKLQDNIYAIADSPGDGVYFVDKNDFVTYPDRFPGLEILLPEYLVEPARYYAACHILLRRIISRII